MPSPAPRIAGSPSDFNSLRGIGLGLALAAAVLPGAAGAQGAPHIAEPMVFDLVRPLGAKRGELEVNALAQRTLSGPERRVEWAPEIEYAVADGFAVELELPLEGLRVAEYKIGLQGTFGTLNGGRGIYGVQYLGVWDRAHGRWNSSLLYVLGNRFGDRTSTLTMIGVGDVGAGGGATRALLVNHTSFYDLADATVAGVEVNIRTGRDRETLVMPQLQQNLNERLQLQGGVGAIRHTGDAWRPRVGLRLVRQL